MYLARVIGRLVASQRAQGLTGVPLQWIQPLDEHQQPQGTPLVACATVSTGPGDLVHFVDGRDKRYRGYINEHKDTAELLVKLGAPPATGGQPKIVPTTDGNRARPL